MLAILAHTALEDIGGSQLLADDPQILVLSLEGEARRAGDHTQSLDLRDLVEEFLGESV